MTLSRLDRAAMQTAYELCRSQWRLNAYQALQHGGQLSRSIWHAYVREYWSDAPVDIQWAVLARLALLLRVLLRDGSPPRLVEAYTIGIFGARAPALPHPWRLVRKDYPNLRFQEEATWERPIRPLWEDAPAFDPNVTPKMRREARAR